MKRPEIKCKDRCNKRERDWESKDKKLRESTHERDRECKR